MEVCILAGGRGTRLQEETTVRPKPMVEIGGRPILWHIMNCLGLQSMNVKPNISMWLDINEVSEMSPRINKRIW